ncbi:MAG TPA: peptidoglycan DD-metalloendopeptidase family protein [Candidatus Limnocylindrales bacterium]|nr:peptidoglycan DD-metalloendopeptidase family protein [Candidatus Limnocylindrales bacterium]
MRRSVPDRRGWSTRPRPVIGRRGFALLLCLALSGGLFVSVAPPSASADALSDAYAKQSTLQQQIAREKAAIAALTASQTALSGKIASTQGTLDAVVSDVNAVKAQIVDMTIQVAQAQASIDELSTVAAQLDQELRDVQAQERTKQDEMNARRAILADRIRTAYDTDRTSLLETVLSSKDFTDIISEVGYQLDFAGQDKILAEQIGQDQRVLAVIHQTVVDTRTQTDQLHSLAAAQKSVLDQQMADLGAAKAQLVKLENETKALLASQEAQYATLAANKASLAATLAAQAKAEAAIEALIRKLVLQALQQGGIPSQYSGSLIWPMPGIVTQEFGCTGFWAEPAYGDCAHFHRGIDIANTIYTPIKAAGPGKVIWSGKSPYDTAWIVVIAHSTHLVSWYAHVDNYTHPPIVQTGEYVAKGQIIAFEGMTGNTTGPHLHWAVQLDNIWVNPRLFL